VTTLNKVYDDKYDDKDDDYMYYI